MIKLIAIDLDGTFLRSDHTYDRHLLREVLDQFQEKGYLFVAASGRPLLSLKEVFQDFEHEMAFIAENGSLLSYKGDMLFQDQPIKPEVYLPMIDAISKSPYGAKDRVMLSGKDGAFISDTVDDAYFNRIIGYYPNLQKVKDFSTITDDIIKIVATFTEESLDATNQWLNETFEGVSSVTTGFDSVDIILSNINKAVAIAKLCDHLGLTNQDVIAFGDNQNDLEMLEFAGLALATENARESIKEMADQIIGNCEDGAVLTFIQEYLKK